MDTTDRFYEALGLKQNGKLELSKFAKQSGVSVKKLRYFNDNNILPSGLELEQILKVSGLSITELMLKLGIIDNLLSEKISKHAVEIAKILLNDEDLVDLKKSDPLEPVFSTLHGKLYQADCMDVLSQIPSNSVDMVFADPPFNLNKLYPSEMDDNLKSEKYLSWCDAWINECIRILKFNGSFFMWNLPKWNFALSSSINQKLTFRHWIAVDIKYSLPIQGRLYPSHYGLLYFVKGDKPNVFHPDRLPMQVCPKCFKDLKDYGGYKAKMNPKGVNLSDVWLDIPPVRHAKYKRRKGANELSLKLLDRIIELSTNEGDTIFDPFGGSGTTYMAAEIKERKWIGCEIGPTDDIVKRFESFQEEREFLHNYRMNINNLFPEPILKNREKLGLWTCESVQEKKEIKKSEQLTFQNFIVK